ncbi:NAD(P)-binding protein [Aureobasidium pullulans]|uniref:NAD(P)-binding protein n=1 Tax=Aureobasidium pullulans TaxID=5580 RepID=A0A4S9XIW2_AURPU|nr:NAD(P)-binding protein [Aureobasidium pullulans]
MSQSSAKTAIFPASGGLGGSTSKHLLDNLPPKEIVLIARNPRKISKAWTDAGVETRYADYDKEETLKDVFVGIKYLNLISYASIEHEHRFKVHKLAIDEAIRNGVRHITYSSLAFGGDGNPTSLAYVMQAHLDTEKYLASIAKENSAFTYTTVRQGLYSESFPLYTAFFDLKNPTKEICIPHDGKDVGIAWAKQDELGKATAKIIAQHGQSGPRSLYVNRTLLLSGPKDWSLEQSVAVLGEAVKVDVKIKPVTKEEYASQPSINGASGYGSGEAGIRWATAFDAIREGEACVTRTLLGDLLGREPESFDRTIFEMAKVSS